MKKRFSLLSRPAAFAAFGTALALMAEPIFAFGAVQQDAPPVVRELEIPDLACESLVWKHAAAEARWNASWRKLKGKERRLARKQNPARDFLKDFQDLADAGDSGAKGWLIRHLNVATDLKSKELKVELYRLFTEVIESEANSRHADRFTQLIGQKGARLARDQRAVLYELMLAKTNDRTAQARCMDQLVDLYLGPKATEAQGKLASEYKARLLKDYLDTPMGGKLWGEANVGAFQGVGTKVPDFPATDIEGNAFRISDYEGQVVMLDFWGFW